MRRLIRYFVILLLLSAVALPVGAKENTYQIPELDMTVEIPSSYDVFTLDMDEDDPLFEKYNYSKEMLVDRLQSGNGVLNAIAKDGKREIVITVFPDAVLSDFHHMSETELTAFADLLQADCEGTDTPISKYEIYYHPQMTFLLIHYFDVQNNTNFLQGYTVYQGKNMYISLKTSTDIKVADKKIMQSVIDSISVEQPLSVDTGKTEDSIYTDQETGVTFQYSSLWREMPLEENELMELKLASKADSSVQIMYGSTDLWAEVSLENRIGYSRKYLDSLLFTEEGIKEMFGNDMYISEEIYGNHTYFRVSGMGTVDTNGTVLSERVTMLVKIENGWRYIFFFNGFEGDPYYEDFEQLVSSVQYPSDTSLGLLPGIAAVGTVVIVLLLVFLIRNKKRKRQDAVPAAPAKQPVLFCRECGKRLDANSRFCSECGTQVVEVRKEEA